MPIKKLSEIRRLPRIGVIRLGEKRKNSSGKEYPSALDYFNLKDAPGVADVFGPKPKSIEIMLPSEKTDVFFPQFRKAYRTSGLFCQGDGADRDTPGTANRVRLGVSDGVGFDGKASKVPKGKEFDPEGEKFLKDNGLGASVKVGERFQLPCLGHDCPFSVQKFCKPIGQFLFLIPRVPSFGCFQISTTSFNSMVDLNSYIEAIRGAAGRISMIPLVLSLVPKKVTADGKAKTIHHLKLEYQGQLKDLIKYRDAKYISAELLPQIGHEVPEDLMPHAGAALDAHLAGAPTPIEGDVVDEEAPPVIEEEPFLAADMPAVAPAKPVKFETPAKPALEVQKAAIPARRVM